VSGARRKNKKQQRLEAPVSSPLRRRTWGQVGKTCARFDIRKACSCGEGRRACALRSFLLTRRAMGLDVRTGGEGEEEIKSLLFSLSLLCAPPMTRDSLDEGKPFLALAFPFLSVRVFGDRVVHQRKKGFGEKVGRALSLSLLLPFFLF